MTIFRFAICAFGIALFSGAALPMHVLGMGFSGVGSAPCDDGSQNIKSIFSSQGAKYFTTGTCTTNGSLGTRIAFPFEAEGRFADDIAVETIAVTPAPIDQPNHYTKIIGGREAMRVAVVAAADDRLAEGLKVVRRSLNLHPCIGGMIARSIERAGRMSVVFPS